MATRAVFSPKDESQATEGFLTLGLGERNDQAVVVSLSAMNTIQVNILPVFSGQTQFSQGLRAISASWTTAVERKALAERFKEQAHKWASETAHLSSPTQRMMHPSYQAILGMAREDEDTVIRLMLRDLRDNRRWWFWALSYLTEENPIKDSEAGKFDKMIEAWVDWGKRRGIL
ncbi:MAG: hypothetical protein ACLP3K_10060 [Candidatus Acidiferrales bacterium]